MANSAKPNSTDEAPTVDDFANLAYGLLWLGETDDRRIHEARRLLLAAIGPEGQKRGLTRAREMMRVNAPTDHGLQLREPLSADVTSALVGTGGIEHGKVHGDGLRPGKR